MDSRILIIAAVVLVIALAVMLGRESFDINIQGPAEHQGYSTTFQLYPGQLMTFSSDRMSSCLEQHQDFPGFRNCMFYSAN